MGVVLVLLPVVPAVLLIVVVGGAFTVKETALPRAEVAFESVVPVA
jgi:hypothetical protein